MSENDIYVDIRSDRVGPITWLMVVPVVPGRRNEKPEIPLTYAVVYVAIFVLRNLEKSYSLNFDRQYETRTS